MLSIVLIKMFNTILGLVEMTFGLVHASYSCKLLDFLHYYMSTAMLRVKTESIFRKLSNFNFQWTKTL